MRRKVFDYIRRQDNPELFHSAGTNSMNPIQMERIAKNIREIIKNQEIILQREDTLEEMKEMVMNKREIVIQLLGIN